MVLRAFRCQRRGRARERQILTRICEEVYYQGRYVWLRSCREVRLIGANLNGPNRIRYRLVSTVDFKCQPLTTKENRRIPITYEWTVAALPVIKGRRRTMFLFVDPGFMFDHRWDTAESDRLSPEEVMFLIGQPQPSDLETVARALCRFRQLIDKYGNLTKEANRILVGYLKA